MKLIIRQYLSSLKERGELDALLPDLLSQMGLDVFLKPGIGSRQHGVDIGAFGKLNSNASEKVYLFSVKAGDLDRNEWDAGKPQHLRPSIIEIINLFIPQRIPSEYKSNPIEICLCFGGEIKEDVRPDISAFQEKEKTDQISFSEWNGDRLAALIEEHMLREELLPANCRSLIRKSLAMLDEPDISFKHFTKLIKSLTETKGFPAKKIIMHIRQLYLSIWILYSWCREQGNLESAYLASELSLLNAWDMTKDVLDKKNKEALSIKETLHSIQLLHLQISNQYIEKIIPHVDKLYAVSNAVGASNPVDVNLKLFNVLGRIAMAGLWAYLYLNRQEDKETEISNYFANMINTHEEAIKNFIINNPMLFTPYKDEQAIDIALAAWFLSLNKRNWIDIDGWLSGITRNSYHMLRRYEKYPSTIQNYADLIEHPLEKTEKHRKKLTEGSILYPYISIFSALMGFRKTYETVQKIKVDFLSHSNFQVFFFDGDSEDNFYRDSKTHGTVLLDLPIQESPEKLIGELTNECTMSNKFYELSAYKYALWPLILVGCRHYRIPIPVHFLIDSFKQENNPKENTQFDDQ